MFTDKELELISLQARGAIDTIDAILKHHKNKMAKEKIDEYVKERLYYTSVVEKVRKM
jgi:ribosomal protein S21